MTSPAATYSPEELQSISDNLPRETPTSITVTGNVAGSIVVGNNNLVGNNNVVYQVHDVHGAVVKILEASLTVTKRPVPSPPPRAPRGFVGREDELRKLEEYIQKKEAVVIRGQEGIGKTTLVRQAAQGQAARDLPDGVLYVEGVEEGQPLGIVDIYQRLFDGIYESVPPLKITASNARGYLRDRSPLIILDHQSENLPTEQLNQLPDILPKGALLVTAPEGRQFSESFYPVDVPVLTSDEAVQLFSEKSGLPRTPANDEAMQKVCSVLNNVPLAIVRTALAFSQNKFGDREKPGTLEALALNLGGRNYFNDEVLNAVGSSIDLMIADSLTADEIRMMIHTALAPGISVDRSWLESVAGGPKTSESLESMELLVSNSPRLRLPGNRQQLLVPGRRRREEANRNISREDLCVYLQQRLETGPLDFEFVGDELGNILGYIGHPFSPEPLKTVIALGKAVDPYLTLHGLWDAWDQVLQKVLEASRALNDPASEAWALHQLGTRAIGLGDLGGAIRNLMDAFRIRGSIGDTQGAAHTLHNLRLILPPPLKPGSTPPQPDPSPLASLTAILSTVLILAGILVILARPALSLAVQADPGSFNPIGQEIQYTYTVRNGSLPPLPGPITVSGEKQFIVCPPIEATGDQDAFLDWNESLECVARYTVTGADVENGTITDTFQASAQAGEVVSGPQTVTLNYDPQYVSLVVQPQAREYQAAGEAIPIAYVVNNLGSAPLTGPLTVTTNDRAEATCTTADTAENGDASIDPKEAVTCTSTYTITDRDVKNGSVTITAQAGIGDVKSAEVSMTLRTPPPPPPGTGLDLVKSANPNTYSDLGQTIAYTYTVTNRGKDPLAAPVSVRDDRLEVVCPPVNSTGNQNDLLESGETLECSANYVITAIDLRRGFVTNTALASAGGLDSPRQSLTIYAGSTPPVLALTKSADRETYSQAGEFVLYTFLVTNPGPVPIPGPITVRDDLVMVRCPHLEKVGDQDSILDPGEMLPCTAGYSITQEDLTRGTVTNQAWAQASNVSSDPQTVTIYKPKDIEPIIIVVDDNLVLDKSASPQFYKQAGDQIQYTYTVRNAGSQPIPGPVSVEDDHLTVACPATGTLEAGAAISCNGTYTITDADIDAGTVTNSATARAGNGSVSGQTTVTVYEKSLQLDAQATPEAYAQVGESIAYTFTITGRSAVPLQGNPIVIADPLQITCETLDAVGNGDQLLDSDEKITCTATQEVTQGDIDNGSIDLQAEADAGNVQSALVMIKVAGPAPAPALTLAKTSPDREYNSIGDVLHYTYVVTNTGNVTLDSTLQVTDDHVDGGAPFDCSAAGPLAPGLFSQCQKSYTITQQDLRLANSSVTNTASAMGSFRQVTVISPPASFTATCPYPGRPWVPFVVSQGETLATISSWYQGTTVTELQEANCMGALDTQPDMTLYVPSPPPTASVSGLVTDSVGSPLGGITVTLVSSSSGAAYRTITNGNGYFYFGGLQPGYYSIFRVGFYLKRGDNRPQNYRVIPQ